MRIPKKTAKEKAKTRHDQNQRYAARKEKLGFRRITLWVPEAALVEAEQRGFSRVGVVFAEGEDSSPAVMVRTADGKMEHLAYTPSLFEAKQ